MMVNLHYLLRDPFLSFQVGDNEDVTGLIMTFLAVSDLGALMSTSSGAFHKCNMERVWAPRLEKIVKWCKDTDDFIRNPLRLGNYPANMPSKQAFAIITYQVILFYRKGAVCLPAWNITKDGNRIRRLEELTRSYETSIARTESRIRSVYRRRRNVAGRLGDALRRAAERVDADQGVTNEMAYVNSMEHSYSMLHTQASRLEDKLAEDYDSVADCITCTCRWKECKRLHDVFTAYLRQHWLFGQTMKDEPQVGARIFVGGHRCHAMKTRSCV